MLKVLCLHTWPQSVWKMTEGKSRTTVGFRTMSESCSAQLVFPATGIYKNVIFTTTMWDEIDQEEGEQREDELQKSYWSEMMRRGAGTARFDNTPASAWKIVSSIDFNERLPLRLQTELVDEKKELLQTAAGLSLFQWFAEIVMIIKQALNEWYKKIQAPKKVEISRRP